MAHRIVVDPSGSTWQLWAVRPTAGTGARRGALAPALREGWPAFERLDGADDAAGRDPSPVAGRPASEPKSVKRRHVPIPPDWEDASDVVVLAWLAHAVPVVRAASPGPASEPACEPASPAPSAPFAGPPSSPASRPAHA